ncbi:hypothetical protein ACXYN8_09000 [Altererythrobacter sp. CAU 1778]
MAQALTLRANRFVTPDPAEFLRTVMVYASGLALILAGPALVL